MLQLILGRAGSGKTYRIRASKTACRTKYRKGYAVGSGTIFL
ncbi:MAG: hypothetical protein ACLR13_06915 [Acutalibacteraceae bacterium]